MDTPSRPPDEEPSSSVLEWVVIGLLVFVVGLLIGDRCRDRGFGETYAPGDGFAGCVR
jgi:hypothetical protein